MPDRANFTAPVCGLLLRSSASVTVVATAPRPDQLAQHRLGYGERCPPSWATWLCVFASRVIGWFPALCIAWLPWGRWAVFRPVSRARSSALVLLRGRSQAWRRHPDLALCRDSGACACNIRRRLRVALRDALRALLFLRVGAARGPDRRRETR